MPSMFCHSDYKGANAWLMRTEVLETPCGIPSPDPYSTWTVAQVESEKMCSLSVAVERRCLLAVRHRNYGTYGVMMRLCKKQFPDPLVLSDPKYPLRPPNTIPGPFELGNGENLIRNYKAYQGRGRSGVKEPQTSMIRSRGTRATYNGGSTGRPPGSGNRPDCDASGRDCTLNGSIIYWDYVREPTKPRTGPLGAYPVTFDPAKVPKTV